jgi:magnesium-transporting ATPase (P-type)
MAYKEGQSLGELGCVSTVEEASLLLKNPNGYEQIESDMILVGFCGITDPARPVIISINNN